MEEKKEQLKIIELELSQLIKSDRKNWIRTAKLLQQIEVEELYEIKAKSFTQYVLQLATDHQINPSTLWRARSSAKLYKEIVHAKTIFDINEKSVKTTPEQLEYYGKVRTIAPEAIVKEIKDRMLQGEGVRHELKRLWQIYSPLKGGKTERGRKPKEVYEVETENQFLVPFHEQELLMNDFITRNKLDELTLDNQKKNRFQFESDEISRANAFNALTDRRWVYLTVREHFVANFKVIFNFSIHSGNKLDALALVQHHKEDTELQIMGVKMVFEEKDFKNLMEKSIQALPFTHFFYWIIPASRASWITILKDLSNQYKSIGILVVEEEELIKEKHKILMAKPSRKIIIEPENKAKLVEPLVKRTLNWI